LKRYINEWLFLVLFWTVISFLYSIAAQSYLDFFFRLTNTQEAYEQPIVAYLLSNLQYLEAVVFGIFCGTLFFGINRITDRTRLSKRRLYHVILIKSFFYLLAILLVFILMEAFFTGLNIAPDGYTDIFFEIGVSTTFIASHFLFFFFNILLTNFFLQVNKIFGEKNLIPFFLGFYHRPKDEHRIFMFIDMHSSTTYAEKYGHSRFSALIQDTVYDLNTLVYKYNADIYQYVGDEIVLTWKVEDGLPMANCVKVFFALKARLHKRKEYYLKNYHTEPTFKAAAHVGVVSVVEIGDIKREIAYHGDVLNTASRVQDMCNELNHDILITNSLANMLWKTQDVHFTKLGAYQLRGKDMPVEISSVEVD